MAISRIGDGQPVDEDKFNELIDQINKLTTVVSSDQYSLIWNGKHDAFDGKATYRIASGMGVATFPGKSTYAREHLPFVGVTFSSKPTVFIQPWCTRQCTATITQADTNSAEIVFHVSDGGKAPSNKARVFYSWMAFGPVA